MHAIELIIDLSWFPRVHLALAQTIQQHWGNVFRSWLAKQNNKSNFCAGGTRCCWIIFHLMKQSKLVCKTLCTEVFISLLQVQLTRLDLLQGRSELEDYLVTSYIIARQQVSGPHLHSNSGWRSVMGDLHHSAISKHCCAAGVLEF